MIDLDFMRLVKLGAIEFELQTLEAGGLPARSAKAIELPMNEIARRAAFLADMGRQVLNNATTSGGD